MDKHFTPEQQRLSEALAHQHRLDYEDAGPKAPHGPIAYKGVTLSSRFDALREFAAMRKAIDLMPELMARRLESIWCDSKACAYYVVTVRKGFYVEALRDEIEDAFRGIGGFNGLDILCDDHKGVSFDPWWPEAEFFDESPALPHSGEHLIDDDDVPF